MARMMTDKQKELFQVMVSNMVNVPGAARLLDLKDGTAYARLRGAINAVGIDAILAQYPMLDGRLPASVGGAGPENKITKAVLEHTNTERMRLRDIEKVSVDNMLGAAEEKLCMVLSYIDADQLGTAKLSELTSSAKTLFDITQVLKGKPTSITARENIAALDKLMPALLKEATRRGLTIEGEVLHANNDLDANDDRGDDAKGHTPPGVKDLVRVSSCESSIFSEISNKLSI